jgi:hypothetical protein
MIGASHGKTQSSVGSELDTDTSAATADEIGWDPQGLSGPSRPATAHTISSPTSRHQVESTGVSEPNTSDNSNVSVTGSYYIETFTGDGSVSTSGWPAVDKWVSFDDFWELNVGLMKQSCKNWDSSLAQNSEEEIEEIRKSIEEMAAETKLDKTFIAAIMMQESNGCTRVHTTVHSHPNPGLLQSHDGTGSCHDRPSGPCPKEDIFQMIKDGVGGTSRGDGLKQCLEESRGDGNADENEAAPYYRAARLYNSGSPSPDGDLGREGVTPCYCSDVANRLLGWTLGNSGCTPEAFLM